MSDSDIWSAVKEGDVTKLHKLLDNGKPSADIGQQIDCNRWTILHHAVNSQNLDVVKLITERFNPDVAAQNFDGLTPLTLACEQSAAVEIIIYLLQLEKETNATVDANESIAPLHFAVLQNRIDLARELIAHGVKVNDVLLRDSSSPLYIVAIVTGNGEMLQCLLDAANVEVPFVADEEDGFTLLDVFAVRAAYATEQKIACFEILYNLGQPNPNAGDGGVRYNVDDILKPAVLSYSSTSLIEYFIETERKWETREEILSLYDRLTKCFKFLPLFVLCECGPVSKERKELDAILREPFLKEIVSEVGGEMEELFRSVIQVEDEKVATNAKQLLQDFATFAQSIQLECIRSAIQSSVQVAFLTKHLMIDKPLMSSRQQLVAYQPIIDCMMSMYGNNGADGIVEILLNDEEQLMRPDLVFPLLKYCTTLFMCPETMPGGPKGNRLFQWFMHLFGTWKRIKCFSVPQMHVFTLKRLARDVVRETVWNGMDVALRARKSATFLDRLQSINVPNELKDYLRYSDYTSLQYFLYHMHDAIDYLTESRNLGGGD
ncbi:uncharacterized protein LOC128715403 [Anopheles marshallii]|uniref:uncharacterized protein LOC128715403 n=1 Tax=Anopheles marshallii TaxID=1521116 RepID=UPI00237A8580|nr:uncharacterized protein LOC128715403 [Anopheles marshallii]